MQYQSKLDIYECIYFIIKKQNFFSFNINFHLLFYFYFYFYFNVIINKIEIKLPF